MKSVGIAFQRGYKRRNKYTTGEVAMSAPKLLNRELNIDKPNAVWVADITSVHIYEGLVFWQLLLIYFLGRLSGGL